MSARFRTTTFDAIEEIGVDDGALRWKPVRRTLGIAAFGTNAYVADAGQEVVEAHDEVSSSGAGGHEELYIVIRGHARFTIDGEELDAPAGTLVFLPEPEAQRQAVAVADGTLVLAIGADPSKPHEVSPWEYYFAAEGPAARGDHAGAVATLEEALPEHEGNPRVHANLALHLARDGRDDAAREHLERALAADAERVEGWIAETPELARLRAT